MQPVTLRHRHLMPFGAELLDHHAGVRFRLYAPGNDTIDVVYDAGEGEQRATMTALPRGWYEYIARDGCAGTHYRFDIGGMLVPDPAARYAPDGVHGPSVVIDPIDFAWPRDEWNGRPWAEHVFYELHVGTFTPEGTFASATAKLEYLAGLGVTAIELMPLSEAPGARNWGYDGVQPFAPSHNYGKPDDLKTFIVRAHACGLAVYLDVVYNHFGPEANYLHAYAKAFYTDEFHTPWGSAIDVVDDDRGDVRQFFIENALYWLQEYRFDGLRIDAVHEIYDRPHRRFLREFAKIVHERADHRIYLVIENEANEVELLEAGFRAQWNDDVHHAVHVAISGQTDGYYAEYEDRTAWRIARALATGFGFQGEHSKLKGAARGAPSAHLELGSFVTFLQNHDQIGNRPFGDRITASAPAVAVRAAAALLLLAPTTPLIFMGEEWGASTPFLFFADFEPELARAVTAGRRNEFGGFAEFADPAARDRIPDPESATTFQASVLRWDEREREPHATWLALYRHLLHVRRDAVVPLIEGLRGTAGTFDTFGDRAFRIRWRLANGTLAVEANLAPTAVAGFEEAPLGRIVYATHDGAYAAGVAPGWSVRWSIE
jgi:malto-oligosyltrehalose trehalohydrolase